MGFKFLINQGACGCDAAAPLLLRRGFEFLLGDIDRGFLLDELQIRVGWKTGCRFALPCGTPSTCAAAAAPRVRVPFRRQRPGFLARRDLGPIQSGPPALGVLGLLQSYLPLRIALRHSQ